jgi:hypothetical protein
MGPNSILQPLRFAHSIDEAKAALSDEGIISEV